MTLSDSHCHLDIYAPELLGEVLGQARGKGVDIIVDMAITLESSVETIHQAQSYQEVLAVVGIHPWYAIPPTDEVRQQLSELAKNEQVVAIGEIGLDYVRNPQTKEIFKELLKYELYLAQETGLPVNLILPGGSPGHDGHPSPGGGAGPAGSNPWLFK
ncbi:TatD family hydrolase [Chloroflexota bacterium]